MCEEVKNVTVCPALEGWRGGEEEREETASVGYSNSSYLVSRLYTTIPYSCVISTLRVYGMTVCDQYMYKYETVLPIHPNNNTTHQTMNESWCLDVMIIHYDHTSAQNIDLPPFLPLPISIYSLPTCDITGSQHHSHTGHLQTVIYQE